MSEPLADDPANPADLDQDAERRMAWLMVGVVLLTLTVAKSLAAVPILGPAALTFAAIIQLYIPLWRAQKLDLDHDFVGLHRRKLWTDLKWVAVLVVLTFPAYAIAHYWFVTEAHQVLGRMGFAELARWVPEMRFAPRVPTGERLFERASWFVQMAATHVLGVALPEETFYRGYLQPRLESGRAPKTRIAGVFIGRAAVTASALFALGHVLGEWNPLRLGPFFPGLVFAWQRNASGSVLGAITFHALCNILGEVLFSLYIPM